MRSQSQSGWMLRCGDETFEAVREVKRNTYEFHECTTRRRMTLDVASVFELVEWRTASIVPPCAPTPRLPSPAWIKDSLRRAAYIGCLTTEGVEGKFQPFQHPFEKVSREINDPKTPSMRTVISWCKAHFILEACAEASVRAYERNQLRSWRRV